MAIVKTSRGNVFLLGSLIVVLGAVSPLAGQKGQNAVFQGQTPTSSPAFVDASKYETTQRDICLTIQQVLTDYSAANGIVVDARGTWTSANLICSTGANPWTLPLPTNTPRTSNVVLLPAGTITISGEWILPTTTRLIGQGPQATIIQASSSFASTDSNMIDMGGLDPSSGPVFCVSLTTPFSIALA